MILLQSDRERMIAHLLSGTVTMTGDGGENDFSFRSDALRWRTSPRCLLLAESVSFACDTRASRRVSHNKFAYV